MRFFNINSSCLDRLCPLGAVVYLTLSGKVWAHHMTLIQESTRKGEAWGQHSGIDLFCLLSEGWSVKGRVRAAILDHHRTGNCGTQEDRKPTR